ncbi:glycosyltransferase, partial [Streptomyces sp. NPDC058375]|uniref:glycosyltransferase n=1 Tax=Streptomyces sp. NPDC058375 TaxID=3346467 RepID=UPI0036527D4D
MSDFSCVITGGGDGEGPGGADALRASVESVLGQSLRGAEALLVLASAADPAVRTAARTLAARAPERVRLVHADPAARTTGALRNAGLDEAGGRYVLVLATGERLHPHACRNLWQAGETSRADLIAGRWSRVTDESGKEREPSWQSELFARSRTLARFTEAPELVVRDALVTGFCLRREAARRHGLRYEEDLAHGEILFGPLAAASVGRIALVRRLIVTGRAVPDRARDLAPLVEAHRRVANTLLAHGLPELREEREKAFARDHLVPLVRSFPRLPAVRRNRVAAAAARTLAGPVPPDLPPLERVAVSLLGRGDAEGILAAAYALSRPATVCAPLTTGADGRVTWGDDPEDPVADITELGHQYRPFGEARLMNRLTRCSAGERGSLLLEGRLVLPGTGGPGPDTPLTATLEFRARGGARAVAFPVEEVRHDGNGIIWRARADVSRRLRPVGVRDTAWDARLILEAGGPDGVRCVSDLFAPQDQVA